MEIVLINPGLDDGKFMYDFLLHWGTLSGMVYKNEGTYEIVSPDFNVRIIKRGFGDFLKEQETVN